MTFFFIHALYSVIINRALHSKACFIKITFTANLLDSKDLRQGAILLLQLQLTCRQALSAVTVCYCTKAYLCFSKISQLLSVTYSHGIFCSCLLHVRLLEGRQLTHSLLPGRPENLAFVSAFWHCR